MSLKILITDDNESDVVMIERAVRNGLPKAQCGIFHNGKELMDYFNGDVHQAPFGSREWILPDLLLLDLFMPEKNGFEVIAEMKEDPALAKVPIIVITGAYKDDVLKDLQPFGIKAVIQKEVLMKNCTKLMQQISAKLGKSEEIKA